MYYMTQLYQVVCDIQTEQYVLERLTSDFKQHMFGFKIPLGGSTGKSEGWIGSINHSVYYCRPSLI